MRVARLAAADRDRDRVEREVPRGKVVLDRAGKRREVDRLLVPVHHHSPGAVTLRQGERRTAEALCVPARGLPRLEARDVEVEDGPPEQEIAHRSPDDPRLLVLENLADPLIHRAPAAAPGASAC